MSGTLSVEEQPILGLGDRRMDSRSTLRYAIDLEGMIAIGNVQLACRVRNLSLGGAFIKGPCLTIGTRVVLRFGGHQLTEVEAPCTVRWHSLDGSGLAFDGLRAVDTSSLAKFIRSAARATGKIPTDAIFVRP
ncbi:MAG: PilZ domain-containing protein [Kofleriaceae bacterium]